jgi:hypothetical protein
MKRRIETAEGQLRSGDVVAIRDTYPDRYITWSEPLFLARGEEDGGDTFVVVKEGADFGAPIMSGDRVNIYHTLTGRFLLVSRQQSNALSVGTSRAGFYLYDLD